MIHAIDIDIFRFFNITSANPIFDILMPIMSEIGSGEGLFILSFLPLLLAKKERKNAALLLWAGLTLTYYVSFFLKGAIGRPRPFIELPDVRLLCVEKSFSFPSTHSLQTFMAATIFSRFFRGGPIFFLCALLVGISRMYLGVHYFSDVLAGSLAGIAIGYWLANFFRAPAA